MTFQPTAKIIADSINTSGDRLTTFVLTFHRFILPEFNTHRQFSRNASSSRAIPVEKMIEKVQTEKVDPLFWGKNKKGMSADEEVDIEALNDAELIWDIQREDAIIAARRLAKLGIHKQVVNRLLEPFSSITVICTATDYDNFFAQRCHPDAQPEIRALADAMKSAYNASVPESLDKGEWHLPLLKSFDWSDIKGDDIKIPLKISTGRCARVSYLNHDGKRSIADDIKLHDRLLASQPPHLSPFEHCAIARPDCGGFANFTGWQSYRNILENKGM